MQQVKISFLIFAKLLMQVEANNHMVLKKCLRGIEKVLQLRHFQLQYIFFIFSMRRQMSLMVTGKISPPYHQLKLIFYDVFLICYQWVCRGSVKSDMNAVMNLLASQESISVNIFCKSISSTLQLTIYNTLIINGIFNRQIC